MNRKTTMPLWKRVFYRRLSSQEVMQPGDIHYDEGKLFKILHANEELSGWKVLGGIVYRPLFYRQKVEWKVDVAKRNGWDGEPIQIE